MATTPISHDRTAEQLRLRLDAAADWGREKIAATRSPCARDLAWILIQLAETTPDEDLAREVKAAEALWRAAMEVERFDARGEE